jgi:hypothetical protein
MSAQWANLPEAVLGSATVLMDFNVREDSPVQKALALQRVAEHDGHDALVRLCLIEQPLRGNPSLPLFRTAPGALRISLKQVPVSNCVHTEI